MSKGLIINEDVWVLIENLFPEEQAELLKCLAAYHRGMEVPEMSRMVMGVYQRITLDNARFDPAKQAELSAKRSEAGKKGMESRWQNITNIANITNDNKNSKLQQEEKRIEKIRIDNKEAGKRKNKNPMLPNDALFDNEEVCAAWSEWVMMRSKLKKPLVGQAENRAVATLKRLSADNPEMAVKVLNQSTDWCWTGLYALNQNYKPRKTQDTSFGRQTDYDAMTRELQYGGYK